MLAEVVVVENVCDAAVIPFNVYNPLLPHVALPYASEVNTAFGVNVPPVTLNVFVTSEVAVAVPTVILLVQVGVAVPAETNICPLVPAAVNPVVFGAV